MPFLLLPMTTSMKPPKAPQRKGNTQACPQCCSLPSISVRREPCPEKTSPHDEPTGHILLVDRMGPTTILVLAANRRSVPSVSSSTTTATTSSGGGRRWEVPWSQ
ncbi:unnamed protein product [Musa banksii]